MLRNLENRIAGLVEGTFSRAFRSEVRPVEIARKLARHMEEHKTVSVSRTYVPVGCQHCSDPPCMHVCPSKATRQRADGIVTIDYDVCIGCAYCAVACPYQARYKVDRPEYSYGDEPTPNELERIDPKRMGVAQKCTFCSDRIDAGLAPFPK